MRGQDTAEMGKAFAFGRRKLVPRVCIVDAKRHIQTFLKSAFDDLGFATCVCADAGELESVLEDAPPDLVMLSALAPETRGRLDVLAARGYEGQVLLFGAPTAPAVRAHLTHGVKLGLSTLPLLATPFNADDLYGRVANMIPRGAPPRPAVNVREALEAGWLELWYQPKIDTRTLSLAGAEALIRLRHPAWGIVEPGAFVPDEHDRDFRALSEFVVDRAVADWSYFLSQYGPLEIAINLPSSYFRDLDAIEALGARMPSHPAFGGMIIEMNGTDVAGNLAWASEVARKLRRKKIGISVDDVGGEWPALLGIDGFPFVEIKVDREFVSGAATDRLKQSVCRQILDLSESYGARTVAEGVETRTDFVAARDMGFDIVQGFLFAKPKPIEDFARETLRAPAALHH